MKKFWKWTNKMIQNEETQEQTPERTLFLNGTIADESWFDDDVTPQLFKEELLSGSGDITVWINSPGWDCVAAAQIYNMLMDYKGMIHNPMTIAMGDSAEMQKAIEMLSEVKESIMNAYEIKTGMSRAKISHLMDAETWMNANKAVELGFADGILTREEPSEAPAADSLMYSETQVVNSLMGRIAEKCRIAPKTEHKTKAEDLFSRLDLIRNWR